jgi:hypothetical protein
MAHYAYVDDTDVVTQVIVGPNEGTEPGGIESWESYFSAKGFGRSVQTSYNTVGGIYYTTDENGHRVPSGDQTKAFRKNYAGIGYTYDEERDAFIPPKPYESWVLNEDTCLWDAPVPMPEDGMYTWDEETGAWIEVVNETE